LLRGLELVVTNLVLALVLAELALQAFAAGSGRSPLLSNTLEDYRLRPGHDYGGGLRGNSLGYPGREFRRAKRPGVTRIAALGDSFAVGPAVTFADNYLCLLERIQPGLEVYNFGVSGAGPREYHQILQQHAWAFEPDLVLVSVFVGNDITEWLATPRHLDPRQHALYLLLTRGWRLLREQFRQAHQPVEAVSQRLSGPALSPETFRQVEARRLAVCFRTAPPGLERKWQRTLEYLERIVQECRRRRVPVALVLIPDEFQVNPRVLHEALAEGNCDGAAVLDLDQPQRRLRAFCSGHGVPYLDLCPAFKGIPDTYAPRDTHWNVRGNRLAANCIAEWLRCSGQWSVVSGQ
jgi:hypothetical protein